jgi:carnitine-CoA ligase
MTVSDHVPLFDPGFERRTIGDLLRGQAERRGDAPWILFDDARLTFGEVDRLVDRYAAGLLRLGVDRHSRVAVMLPNSPRFLALATALGRIGAVFVPVNLALRGESLRHVVRQSAATTLVIHGPLLERAVADGDVHGGLETIVVDGEPTVEMRTGVRLVAIGEIEEAEPVGTLPASAADTFDPWCVMFTSGTTGPAKGAVMSHQYWTLVPSTLAGPERDVRADDVFYASSPMFHAASWLVQILPSLLLGLPVGIDASFSASTFWDRVRHYGATQLLTMGATHLWLWNQPPSPADRDHPGRVWAPVPLPPALHDPFRERFGVGQLWSTYGGTEFMNVVCTDVRRPLKPGTSGRARPGVELQVQDDHGLPLAPGETGELCVRPTLPHAIFQGYVGMPEETLERFRDLWYHTGDLVRIDADGDLTFVDRKDDYLRVRGENVSSFEVETAFTRHPAVAEAAAFSIRSAESALVAEDEVMVALVPSEGAQIDPEEALRFAARDLPHFAVPRYLEIVDDLPRTATGRVQKHQLRDRGLGPDTFDRVRANIQIDR